MSLKRRIKRAAQSVRSVAQTVGQKSARVASVAAPIVGGALFGPGGAAIGGAVGAAASQVHQSGAGGSREARRSRLRRSLTATAASVTAAGALSLASGGGTAASLFGGLFGGGAKSSTIPGGTPETAAGKAWNPITGEYESASPGPSAGGTSLPGSFADAEAAAKKLGKAFRADRDKVGSESNAGGVFPGAGWNPFDMTGDGSGDDGNKKLLVLAALGAGVYFLAKHK